MKKKNVWFALIAYFILLALDVGLNLLAIFIPSLGGLAESFTEIILESLSAIIVLILAFAKN